MTISQNNLKSENEVLKRLLKDGYILVNFDCTDCDGCSAYKVLRFESLESLYKDIQKCAESAEGSFRYSVPHRREDGSFDLNEEFTGGQWSN